MMFLGRFVMTAIVNESPPMHDRITFMKKTNWPVLEDCRQYRSPEHGRRKKLT